MPKVSRRDLIKAFAGAGIVLATSSTLLNVAAAKPEVLAASGKASTNNVQAVSPSSALRSSGSESVVIHVKDGKLIGYKGAREFVFSDDELVSRITAKFGD